MSPSGVARAKDPDPWRDVTSEDDPFRPVLLWFKDRFQAFDVSARRSPEGDGRLPRDTVRIDIDRRKTRSQEQVRQIVSFSVPAPPPQPVIERLADLVQANPWGHVEIETWQQNASRWPAETFPADAYLVIDWTKENEDPWVNAEVLSSDGRVLRKLRQTGKDQPLQWGEDETREETVTPANSYGASEARRLAQLLAEEPEQRLARIPSEVLERFVQEARQAVEQVERHRFEDGDKVLIKVDMPLIEGEFVRLHEDGEAEIRIKVPMVNVRPGDREGE